AEVKQAIAQGIDFLKSRQDPQGRWSYRFNHEHTLGMTALAGLALLENGVDRRDPAIAKAGEVVPALAEESNQTYDLALPTLFLARWQSGSRGADDALIRRLAERLAGGQREGMWTYTVPHEAEAEGGTRRRRSRSSFRGEAGDNSNTQFALLGIWAAGRHE